LSDSVTSFLTATSCWCALDLAVVTGTAYFTRLSKAYGVLGLTVPILSGFVLGRYFVYPFSPIKSKTEVLLCS